MSALASHKIGELFAAEGATGESLRFEWALVNRRGRPLILLPRSYAGARRGLNLYAAQRLTAKLMARGLPFLIGSPLRNMLSSIQVQVNTASALLTFMAQRLDLKPEQLPPPAILFGNQPEAEQRFVLLGLNEHLEPRIVVKASSNPSGRSSIDREAAILNELPIGLAGCIKPIGVLKLDTISAVATDYYPGQNPKDAAKLPQILTAWLRPEPVRPLASFAAWERLTQHCSTEPIFMAIARKLKGVSVRSAIWHGDFAPWNIRANDQGDWTVLDWERAELVGIPGWDWFHYIIQVGILKRRLATAQLIEPIEAMLSAEQFRSYASVAGITESAKALLLAYLHYQVSAVQPGEGLEASQSLLKALGERWQFAAPAA